MKEKLTQAESRLMIFCQLELTVRRTSLCSALHLHTKYIPYITLTLTAPMTNVDTQKEMITCLHDFGLLKRILYA